jgi:hypothetical protein
MSHTVELFNRLKREVAESTPTTRAAGRGRLILAIDATFSRQSSWDRACDIQAAMFEVTAAISRLEIQLLFYRADECRASKWVTSPMELHRIMRSVHCVGGNTQIERVLEHAIKQTTLSAIGALVFVGDAMEENGDRLCHLARELGALGTPVFILQEGSDRAVKAVFEQIAFVSKGAYLSFDLGSMDRLKQLLAGIAVYATGGLVALEAYGRMTGGEVLRLTRRLRR